MSVVKKLKAVEAHEGEWFRVGEVLYINKEGKYITYSYKTNRLVLDGVNVYLDEDGTALLMGKEVAFRQITKEVYKLTKELKRR